MTRADSRPPFERFAQHWLYRAVAWIGSDAIVYSTNITGQFNLWRQSIGPRGAPGYARPLTMYRDRVVAAIAPSPDGRTVYYTADQEGDEQYQLYRVGVEGGEPTPIVADRKVRHELGPDAVDPTGRRLLYVDNARTPEDFDVTVHDLDRGTLLRPLEEGYIWDGPTWDPSGRRFFVRQYHSNTRIRSFVHDLLRRTTIEILPHDSDEIVAAQAWTPDGRGLLVRSNLGGEYCRLEHVDLARGRPRVLLDGPHDVERCLVAGRSGTILAVVNEGGYSILYTSDHGSRFRRIAGLLAGCTDEWPFGQNIGLEPGGRRAAVLWHTGIRPAEIVVVPLPRGRSTNVTESRVGGVSDVTPRPPRLVRFRSFDGRLIPAFYYVPRHRSAVRSPAVLSIHGGPESQERPMWKSCGLYAYLLACGIHVLAPNIRGSTGYGKTYQKLIHHDWGGNELKDLRAAAEWLRHRPEIDPHRLGVFGGSFGGFATLSCLTRLPEYWKVGVDLFGPSNLITFVKTVPPFWIRFMDEWVGNAMTEAKFLRDRSPISYIDQVQADVLVVQGARDPRVVQAESDQMVEQLRAHGRTVEYLVFPDEGHGFTKPENLQRAYGAAARFLTDHLVGSGAPTPS